MNMDIEMVFTYLIREKKEVTLFLSIIFLIFIYGTYRRLKRTIVRGKHLFKIETKKEIYSSSARKFSELEKIEKKFFLSQALLLTLPASLGLIFPSVILIFDAGSIIKEPTNLIGIIIFLIGEYCLCNYIQSWFLHSVLTNSCKIVTEKAIAITKKKNEKVLIKTKGSWNGTYIHPTIQYVTTSHYKEVPTLYRGVSLNIKEGDNVYIIILKNGKIFALDFINKKIKY